MKRKEYKDSYQYQYEKASQKLFYLLGENIARISHISITSIKGLVAKSIVDILLEIPPHADMTKATDLLLQEDWILMSKEITSNGVKFSFDKGYTPKGCADEVFPLHLRYKGDWDEFYFREYLIELLEVAEKYVDCKKFLLDTYKYNCDGYIQAKTKFILNYTKQARTEYGESYTTVEKNLKINCK